MKTKVSIRNRISRRGLAATAQAVAPRLQIKSILVPTDLSPASKKALAYAVAFAEKFGAKLTLLHVVAPIEALNYTSAFPLFLPDDKIKAICTGLLEQMVKEEAIDPKLIEKMLVRNGRAFHEITEAAKTLNVDLIIISTHGYTGLEHALLGSTTERVVRHARCPVLVVREREHEFVRIKPNKNHENKTR